MRKQLEKKKKKSNLVTSRRNEGRLLKLKFSRSKQTFVSAFLANVTLPHPLKTLGNRMLSDVFRRYRNKTLAWNWLTFDLPENIRKPKREDQKLTLGRKGLVYLDTVILRLSWSLPWSFYISIPFFLKALKDFWQIVIIFCHQNVLFHGSRLSL